MTIFLCGVYICVYIHTYIIYILKHSVYKHMYACGFKLCVSAYVCMCACKDGWMCTYTCTFTYTYTRHIHMHIHIHTGPERVIFCVHNTYTYMYIYICVCMCMYIYMYLLSRDLERPAWPADLLMLTSAWRSHRKRPIKSLDTEEVYGHKNLSLCDSCCFLLPS